MKRRRHSFLVPQIPGRFFRNGLQRNERRRKLPVRNAGKWRDPRRSGTGGRNAEGGASVP
ncbi:hypothetical protein HMPREF3039_03071 [Akkermansia sp. KLE1798]|nr:hypothetical protein HMPREF3039_03071 [Akkermansia sp. KLE1798]